MQIPIIPFRGKTKPYGSIPRINWQHPLARGLVSYGYDAGFGPIDLVTGGLRTINNTVNPPFGGPKQSIYGSALTSVATTSTAGLYTLPGSNDIVNAAVAGSYSIACGFMLTATPAAGSTLFSTCNATSTTAIAIRCFGSVATDCRLSFAGGNVSTAAGALTLNTYKTWLGVGVSAFVGAIYVDGALSISAATTINAAATAGAVPSFFGLRSSAAQQFVSGTIYYGALWKNRALTAAEARLLHDDPYCFLIYPEDEMFAELVGAVAVASAPFAQTDLFIPKRVPVSPFDPGRNINYTLYLPVPQGSPTLLGGSSTIVDNNATWFPPFAGLSWVTPEALTNIFMRAPGTFYGLQTSINNIGTARSVVVRKNAADTILKVSPPDTTAAFANDLVHYVHYNAGDTFDIANNNTTAAYTLSSLGLVFQADSGTVGLCSSALLNFALASTAGEYFCAPGGIWIGPGAVAPSDQFLVRAPAVYRAMSLQVITNTGSTNTPFRSNKNGVTGNQSIVVGAGVTGVFEDLMNTDHCVSGDLYCYDMTALTTTGIQFRATSHVAYDTSVSEIFAFGLNAWAFSASNQFASINGSSVLLTSENGLGTGAGLGLGVRGTVSRLRMNLLSNSMTGTSTVNLRKNGANGNQVLTIATTITGAFEDTTHTDTFEAVNDIAAVMYSGGTSGSIIIGWSGSTFTPAPSPPLFNFDQGSGGKINPDWAPAFLQPYNLNLFTNPIPFNQVDWSKPFKVPLTQPQPSPELNINLFTNPFPFPQNFLGRSSILRPAQPLDQTLNLNLFSITIQARSPHVTKLRTVTPLAPADQAYNPNLYSVAAVANPFNQTDWAGSRFFDRTTPSPDQIYNPNLFTNPLPFGQNDSKSVFFDRATPSPDQIYNPNLYSAVAVANPFNQTYWPAPFVLRTPIADYYNIVIDTQQGVQSPFNQTDWAKGRFPPPSILYDQPLNLNLFTSQAITTTRSPHITKLSARQFSPVLDQAYNPNLFTNPIPFSQNNNSSVFFDRATPSPDQIYNPNLYSIVAVFNPFNQIDWSKPFVPRPASPLDQTLNINLFTNPIPFNQIDWSKPVRSPRASVQTPDTLNPNIFTNPIPFNQVDWSRPVRIVKAARDEQPLNLNLFSFIVVQVPFNQTDWSRPFRIPLAPFTASPPLNLNLFTNPVPFMVTDRLPNRRLPLVLPQPPYSLNLNLFQNPVPFNQIDWSKPFRVRGYPNHTLPQNLNLLGLLTYLASLQAKERGDFLLAVLYRFNLPLSAYVDIIENNPRHRGNLGIIEPFAQSSIIASISQPMVIPVTGGPVVTVAGARVAIIQQQRIMQQPTALFIDNAGVVQFIDDAGITDFVGN